MGYYIGVDIGGTNIRAAIANDNEILLKLVSPTKKRGPDTTLSQQVIDLIETGLTQLEISKGDIFGIGTSSAGPFVDHGDRIFTTNISGPENGWKDVPYIAPLREHFGVHIKYEIANDCVSSVKAEQLFGAGQGFRNLVYVTISTGIGGGIIVDNHILSGKSKNAGHVGHFLVKKDGPLCGCGQRGCIEAIASGPSIARRAMEAGLIYEGTTDITAKMVFDLYRRGETTAQQIIHETIEYLGMMFSNIISVSDCEAIVIGGSVFIHNVDVLLQPIVEYVASHSFQTISEGVQFKVSELKDFVGDLAGLSLIFPNDIIEIWQKTQPWKRAGIKICRINI